MITVNYKNGQWIIRTDCDMWYVQYRDGVLLSWGKLKIGTNWICGETRPHLIDKLDDYINIIKQVG